VAGGPRRLHSEGYERMVDPESYIDTNIFIYWLGGHPTFGGKAREWVKRVGEAPRGRYATSSLAIYQALVIMAGLTGRSLKTKNQPRR